MNKNRRFLQEALGGDSGEAKTARTKDKEGGRGRSSILTERHKSIDDVLTGKKRTVVQMKVPPSECRMWDRHNRRYELLNEQSCRDLIDGFKATGQQEFPAIVRELTDDSDFRYEVISGARRHWTSSYLGWDFLIEVRDMDDEVAFRLSDIENRDRQDISDYERALDYSDALSRYYDSQKQMAERLECTEKWLSQYLDLARLPEEVVDAYGDVREIKIYHGAEIKKLLKPPTDRRKVLKAAGELKGQGLAGATVLATLRKACKAAVKPARNTLGEYAAKKSGKPMLTVVRSAGGDLTLRWHRASGATDGEVLTALKEVVEKYTSH